MPIRLTAYAIVLVILFLAGTWLAFGPGVEAPLELFLLPAGKILRFVFPSLGSSPSFDLVQEGVVGFAFWFLCALIVDGSVTLWRRRRIVT